MGLPAILSKEMAAFVDGKAGKFSTRLSARRSAPLQDAHRNDGFFVREYTEFPDIETYLHGYSILGVALEELRVPSCLIAAADDPIIPSADLADMAQNPNLELLVLPWGGHCGFVTDYRLTSYIERIVIDELDCVTQPRSPGASP